MVVEQHLVRDLVDSLRLCPLLTVRTLLSESHFHWFRCIAVRFVGSYKGRQCFIASSVEWLKVMIFDSQSLLLTCESQRRAVEKPDSISTVDLEMKHCSR